MKYGFTNEADGKKLTEFLSENIDGLTLGVLKRQMKMGEVRVNGIKTRENATLSAGDRVDIFLPKDAIACANIEVVYADDNIVVADKPKNTDTENNLVRMLGEKWGRLYPVHRLDRNTEGLVILARDEQSENILCNAVKERKISKFYRALLYGHFDEKDFTARAYLRKNSDNNTVRIYSEPRGGAKEIITRFSVKEEYENYSDVEIELITGRTHQIRAHAAYLGHAVLGDGKYAPREVLEKFEFKTQQLRAVRIIMGGLDGKLAYLNGKVFQV